MGKEKGQTPYYETEEYKESEAEMLKVVQNSIRRSENMRELYKDQGKRLKGFAIGCACGLATCVGCTGVGLAVKTLLEH